MSKSMRAIIAIVVTLAIWFSPVPAGVKVQAWHLLALFVGTIVAFILQPLPNGATALISLVLAMLTKTLSISQGLSSFGNSTLWLIVAAFLFAKGFIKTGLGRRIAYMMTQAFGDSTLKLAYAFSLSDLIIAPATPSNTARAGGVLFPIVKSLCLSFNSEPGPTARKLGSYLMLSVFQANAITSAMFMTAMAANPLIAELAKKTFNIEISWGTWFMGAVVPGLIALFVVPYYLYKAYPPEIKYTPEAKKLAKGELDKMGPASTAEKIMFGIFILALVLWATSSFTKLHATLVALLGICIMLITKVIDWSDVIEEKSAWDTLIWMGVVIGLAGFLAKFGFIAWLAKTVAAALKGISWITALVVLLLVYLYSHYGFASLTAHVTAMYAAFGAVAIAAGAPAYLVALALAYASNLCAGITHFATGPAPIYFGAGYVDQPTWWKHGFVISVINMVIWVGIGGIWWKILGLW